MRASCVTVGPPFDESPSQAIMATDTSLTTAESVSNCSIPDVLLQHALSLTTLSRGQMLVNEVVLIPMLSDQCVKIILSTVFYGTHQYVLKSVSLC